MPTLRQAVRRLRAQGILPRSGTVSVKDLHHQFQPIERGSTRSLLLKMLASYEERGGGSTHPYYRRPRPIPSDFNDFAFHKVDLTNAHLAPYGEPNPAFEANYQFDKRAAAAVRAAIGDPLQVTVFPNWPPGEDSNDFRALLERKFYEDGPSPIHLLTAKCLAAMAYKDYFPSDPQGQVLRDKASQAIMGAWPGWCGTFGPGVNDFIDVGTDPPSGDYDMNEMHILPLIYAYYDELTPDARERVIVELLKNGQMQRPNEDPTYTSEGAPNDWRRAGFILGTGIPETENHVLMIATARYLTNQLLYQRFRHPIYDNRRNGDSEDSRPNCMDNLLDLMRAILVDDFGEYNSKPYQAETRRALTNLCSFAYDHEVRLAARMVLDYISARYAVSSNDLRRLIPFRRKQDASGNAARFGFEDAFMSVGLLGGAEQEGADPMSPYFALLAGNTRAYEKTCGGWGIHRDSGGDMTVEAHCCRRSSRNVEI